MRRNGKAARNVVNTFLGVHMRGGVVYCHKRLFKVFYQEIVLFISKNFIDFAVYVLNF